MVVGPLMQGVVLAGIIYWYSKGMMSMINDYYRSEFHRKLKEVNETTIETSSDYDLDNFESLLDVESFGNDVVAGTGVDDVDVMMKSLENSIENEANMDFWNDFIVENIKGINEESCYAPTAIDIFLYIVGLNVSQHVVECWALKETQLEYKI